jgi:hypothetical protein
MDKNADAPRPDRPNPNTSLPAELELRAAARILGISPEAVRKRTVPDIRRTGMRECAPVESKDDSESRPRASTVAVWLALLALVCAIAVILGSLDFRTTRTWELGVGIGQAHQEGAARWAVWTLLAGAVALGLLAISVPALARAVNAGSNDARRKGRICAVLAVPFLGNATTVSAMNWMRVLDEQQRATEYTLVIAQGLPVVAVASAIGAGLALMVFGLTFASSGR